MGLFLCYNKPMKSNDRQKYYICIDLKSFYASVECVERGLDPMTTNLVVADPERSDKTICLAVSPSMKKLGVSNRCRVFEIPKNIDYIMATPRMQKYIDYAAEIYDIYLDYFSKDDIHVYSIDEAFMDVTAYLHVYNCDAKQLAVRIMKDIWERIGVRATCGIGTNLYLTKIALDITAKHSPDFIGVLDEETYRKSLWNHRPLTDFWRIGPGTVRRLEKVGIYTMGDIAKTDEKLLYKMFGVDAELLIDHAWGREPVTIADIKNYRPKTNSLSNGQVLMRDYTFDEGRTIIREMTDQLCLDLVSKGLVTDSVTISVGYARPSGSFKATLGNADVSLRDTYFGPREGGTVRFEGGSCEESVIVPEVVALYDRIMDRSRDIRRVTISCNNVRKDEGTRQISLFDIAESAHSKDKQEVLEKDKKIQQAIIDIKEKYGKNAMVKGMNLHDESTGMERNRQIGGHKSGE